MVGQFQNGIPDLHYRIYIYYATNRVMEVVNLVVDLGAGFLVGKESVVCKLF